jgi:gentisate 1,2-dioxygenase
MGKPRPRGEAMVWRWNDIYPRLFEAAEVLGAEGVASDRRTIRLITPGLLAGKWTTETLTSAIQMILPHETAPVHRHTPGAFRYIIEGSGAYTTVDGERFDMAAGDLILTPNWYWHGHDNPTDKPMVWLDVLDVPLCRFVNAMFREEENEGSVVPRPSGSTPHFHYRAAESLSKLRGLPDAADDPYDGLTLEHHDRNGGPTLPTCRCRLHLLRSGRTTKRHRHTWNTICHVVSGRGETLAGDKTLTWGPRDTFVVPSYHPHEHHALDGDAVVFSVTDEPVLSAFGLARMEEG